MLTKGGSIRDKSELEESQNSNPKKMPGRRHIRALEKHPTEPPRRSKLLPKINKLRQRFCGVEKGPHFCPHTQASPSYGRDEPHVGRACNARWDSSQPLNKEKTHIVSQESSPQPCAFSMRKNQDFLHGKTQSSCQ